MLKHLFSAFTANDVRPKSSSEHNPPANIKVKIVGVGGGGGNAVARMRDKGIRQVETLALNTDVQALAGLRGIPSYAIGPQTVNGMGSGGKPEIGRKAVKESQAHIAELLDDADMVFITAGMGGGTGTGASSTVADIARKKGALTVGIVTLPFSFEGSNRRAVAMRGLHSLRQKVDTLIAVENDRLLPSLNGNVSLQSAFEAADEVLRQGVSGISEIITVPGMINVDFADVRSIMSGAGAAFMAHGEAKGKWAAIEAAHSALANPLFNAPMHGASGVLLNISGGKDLTLGQVHEVAEIIRKAAKSDANVIFGVVQDARMRRRVSITLVATGIGSAAPREPQPFRENESDVSLSDAEIAELLTHQSVNGLVSAGGHKLL